MSARFRNAFILAAGALAARAFGQQAAESAKSAAPVDLTGYWVSIVTEDWRYRMLTAPKGDYYSLPITREAIQAADAWDRAKDPAESCKNYGAAVIMRQPGRVHITWQDDSTLKFEMDAGRQTRLMRFGAAGSAAASRARTLQGLSAAEWQTPGGIRAALAQIPAQNPITPGFPGINTRGDIPPMPKQTSGTLKVTTSQMLGGFLRNNGVPYSENAHLTEYYDLHKEKNGDQWLVVTSIVEDPQYLAAPWVTSTHFRKQPDSSGWDPQPCEAR